MEPVFTSSPITQNDEKNTSLTSLIASQFVQEVSSNAKRLFCPFCLFDYGFDFLLKNHLKETHLQELNNFANVNLKSYTLDLCPYCSAKFYIRDLLPKHVVRKHQESILNLVASTRIVEYISCNFCKYKVLSKQSKLFFIHVENKHLEGLKRIISAFQLNNDSAGINRCQSEVDKYVKYLSISSTSSRLSNGKDIVLRPILKRPEYRNIYNAHSVRRKLRFDIPEDDVKSESEDKENCSPDKMPSSCFGLGRKYNSTKSETYYKPPDSDFELDDDNHTNTTPILSKDSFKTFDGVDVLKPVPYKCGLCIEGFSCNALLVRHIKRLHKGFKLKARYECGQCKAKFYKNSYLIRHHYYHHSNSRPKCLNAAVSPDP